MASIHCPWVWTKAAKTTWFINFAFTLSIVAADDTEGLSALENGIIGLGVGVGAILLAAAGFCIWYKRKKAAEHSSGLRKELARDSVAVTKMRNSKLSEASVAAALSEMEKGRVKMVAIHSECETADSDRTGKNRVSMVAFNLPGSASQRLKAEDLNDSLSLQKRKTSSNAANVEPRTSTVSGAGEHPAVAYYQQQLAQLSSAHGEDNSSSRDAMLPGQTAMDHADDDSSHRCVQFGAAQIVPAAVTGN